jgi:exodeoxyribonuclease V gamma subunit
MPLRVHRSNVLPGLVDALVDRLEGGALPEDPLTPVTLAVPGRAVADHLAEALARQLGVWALPDLPYLGALLERLLDALGAPSAEAAAFAPAALPLAVHAVLPGVLAGPAGGALARYLDPDPSSRRRSDLARHLAQLVERYALYRPAEVLACGEAAPAGSVAGHLVHALVARFGPHLLPHRLARARARLAAPGPLDLAPIHLVGFRSLPPAVLELLVALGRRTAVDLYLLTVSREWIADATRAAGASDAALHPLVVSSARAYRETQALLETLGDYEEDGQDRFRDPAPTSRLHVVQADLLHARRRGIAGCPSWRGPAEDDSLTIHACASPLRELEVVRDQLLAAFTADPTLAPHEVAVLVPDLETYGPLVEAGLVAAEDPAGPLPCAGADLAAAPVQGLVQLLRRLLQAGAGRLTPAEGLALIRSPLLAGGAGLEPEDLDDLAERLAAANLRGGADAGPPAEPSSPGSGATTWRGAVDRLLLGVLVPDDGVTCVGAVRPAGAASGEAAERLGRLSELVDALLLARDLLAGVAPVAAWQDRLGQLLARLVDPAGPGGGAAAAVRGALHVLAAAEVAVGTPVLLDAAGLLDLVADRVGDAAPAGRGGAGAISVGELPALSGLPFRVVAVVGLDDERFPGRDAASGLDALALGARPGDPSRRDEDRSLFLAALAQASDRVILTYGGRSPRDGTLRPPSVVLEELLDVLEASFGPLRPEVGPLDPYGVVHPLWPWSPEGFAPAAAPGRASHAVAFARGAAARVGPPQTAPAFLARPLPPPREPVTEVRLAALADRLARPAAAFLRDPLGLRPARAAIPDLPDEALSPEPLERYALGQRLVTQLLRGVTPEAAGRAAARGGDLPVGTLGEVAWAAVLADAQAVVRAAPAGVLRLGLRARTLTLALPGATLVGELRDPAGAGACRVRFGPARAADLIRLWLDHLLLAAVDRSGAESELVGLRPDRPGRPAGRWRLRPVADPVERLADLVALHLSSLQVPLRLFPDASLAYARRAAEPEPALLVAAKAFQGSYQEGAADRAVQRLHGDRSPVTAGPGLTPPGDLDLSFGFSELSTRVMGPLLSHLTEEIA